MNILSSSKTTNIMLAEDDLDDCLLFKDALMQILLLTELRMVHHGEQLMEALEPALRLPDLLFLDLNMPRKKGFDCLAEIRQSERLKNLPVIILSTSFDITRMRLLYEAGATRYIRKPSDFSALKNLLSSAITLFASGSLNDTSFEHFIVAEQPFQYEPE